MQIQSTAKRPRITQAELRQQISNLRKELEPLRRHYERTVLAAKNALPDAARMHYLGLQKVSSREELGEFLYRLRELVMEAAEPLPPRYPGAETRVTCPLCTSSARGPFLGRGDGWGAVAGLELHLKRDSDENGCYVMQTLIEHAERQFEAAKQPGDQADLVAER